MSPAARRTLYWAPRALAVLVLLFFVVLAFGLTGLVGARHFPLTPVGIVVDSVFTGLLVTGLALAWRWEWVGALVFLGMGTLFAVCATRLINWASFLLFDGPLFLIGLLFLIGWIRRREVRFRA